MAEWLGTGLQNLLRRFNSASDLKRRVMRAGESIRRVPGDPMGSYDVRASGGIGIHATLKMLC